MSESIELPRNKPLINGKYKTKDAIKSAIYKVFEQDKVEGRYSDENWDGIKKLQTVLNNNGIQFETLDADYSGHGEVQNSNLPTKKIYRFRLDVRDKEGKTIPLFLKVTCAFIGKTGTMADREYELTYYFF